MKKLTRGGRRGDLAWRRRCCGGSAVAWLHGRQRCGCCGEKRFSSYSPLLFFCFRSFFFFFNSLGFLFSSFFIFSFLFLFSLSPVYSLSLRSPLSLLPSVFSFSPSLAASVFFSIYRWPNRGGPSLERCNGWLANAKVGGGEEREAREDFEKKRKKMVLSLFLFLRGKGRRRTVSFKTTPFWSFLFFFIYI